VSDYANRPFIPPIRTRAEELDSALLQALAHDGPSTVEVVSDASLL